MVNESLSKMNDGSVKIDTTTSPQMQSSIIKKTREELIAICKEKSIKGYSGKKKEEIVKLLLPDSLPKNEVITEITPIIEQKLKEKIKKKIMETI